MNSVLISLCSLLMVMLSRPEKPQDFAHNMTIYFNDQELTNVIIEHDEDNRDTIAVDTFRMGKDVLRFQGAFCGGAPAESWVSLITSDQDTLQVVEAWPNTGHEFRTIQQTALSYSNLQAGQNVHLRMVHHRRYRPDRDLVTVPLGVLRIGQLLH